MPQPSSAFDIQNKKGVAQIKIVGGFGFWENNSDRFTQMVDALLEKGVREVDAYISSPGGSMTHANEIGNQISRFKGKKKVKVGAIAASAAFTLLTYFDERHAHENTMGMIHEPISQLTIEHEEQFDSSKKLYIDLRNNVVRRLARTMNMTEEEVLADMKKTTWYNAQELKDKGFFTSVDGIDDELPEDTNQVANHLGYSLPVNMIASISNSNNGQQATNPTINKMKNQILALMATLGLANVNDESSDTDVFNSLKHFVNQKMAMLNLLVNGLQLELPTNYTGEQLFNAVKQQIDAQNAKVTELQNKLDAINTEKLEAMKTIAKEKKGLTENQVKTLETLAKSAGIEAAVSFLNDAKDVGNLLNGIQDKGGIGNAAGSMNRAIAARISGIKQG